MQMATLTSTPDLTILLEQARGFDLADSRLLEVTGRIRGLAEARNDHEALFQATWLLGQHHLSKHEHALALEVLESLLDASFTLSAERHADRLLALTDDSNGTDQINKVLQYGNKALGFFRERQDVAKQVHLHGFLGLAFTSLCSFHESLEHHKAFAELEIKQLKDINEKRTQALTVQFEVARLQQEHLTDQLKNLDLVRINERLEELSLRDALTGLHNRRYLDAQLGKLHLETQGAAQPFTVLILDIDNFKQVNDSFSHLTGDQVLKTVAQLFVDQVRASDLVVRYGGEKFVLVLCDIGLEQALIIAEKLRAKVEAYPWHNLHPDFRITVSIGLCADTTLGHHERMLAVADDKMYVAKRNGKNQVQA